MAAERATPDQFLDDLSETLAIRGIEKSFPIRDPDTGLMVPRKVLDGVTFDIPAGKFVVLFGPNASGKTTLLKIIAGLEPLNAGRILMPRSDMKIDMIFQNYRDSLYPWKTVLDNISFPLELQGISRHERRRAALELLEKFGANILSEGEYKKYPYQLSGGQQQFIAFARSFLAQPDVLLLDESFAALDHDTRYLMQDVLTKMWEDTKFFAVFISHSVWEAVYMADIVVLLSKKPARVLNMVDIPLPRPRRREVEYSPEFFELRSNILRVFEAELYGTSPRSP